VQTLVFQNPFDEYAATEAEIERAEAEARTRTGGVSGSAVAGLGASIAARVASGTSATGSVGQIRLAGASATAGGAARGAGALSGETWLSDPAAARSAAAAPSAGASTAAARATSGVAASGPAARPVPAGGASKSDVGLVLPPVGTGAGAADGSGGGSHTGGSSAPVGKYLQAALAAAVQTSGLGAPGMTRGAVISNKPLFDAEDDGAAEPAPKRRALPASGAAFGNFSGW
jgi:hypothetical protein